MSTTKPAFQAAVNYNTAKTVAIKALDSMTFAMKEMSAEHIDLHTDFDDVQEQLQDLKKAFGVKELHVEVIRSRALEGYLSEGNLPKVTARGHMELDEIHKKTARLVESLLGDRRCTCGHRRRPSA